MNFFSFFGKKSACMALAAAGLMGVTAVASATPIKYDLTTTNGGPQGTYFGSVTLDDIGNEVDFTVTLTEGAVFANTGTKQTTAFAFNLGSGFAIALTGATATSGVYVAAQAPAAITQNPFGNFSAGIDFTSSARTGTSGNYSAPLTFKVTKVDGGGVSYTDFQTLNASGYLFSADIGLAGNTGNVATTINQLLPSANASAAVPEPTTLALLGLGIAAFGMMRRRSS